jgi:hypothetical protein
MTLWWGSDVDHIRPGFVEKLLHICEICRGTQPLLQLLGHQFLSIAHTDNLSSRNKADLLRMPVGNLSASNNRSF